MTKATVKKVAECILSECMGFGFDELFPRAGQEAGPVRKVGGAAVFDLTFHRKRGTPKTYKITVEEIC